MFLAEILNTGKGVVQNLLELPYFDVPYNHNDVGFHEPFLNEIPVNIVV